MALDGFNAIKKRLDQLRRTAGLGVEELREETVPNILSSAKSVFQRRNPTPQVESRPEEERFSIPFTQTRNNPGGIRVPKLVDNRIRTANRGFQRPQDPVSKLVRRDYGFQESIGSFGQKHLMPESVEEAVSQGSIPTSTDEEGNITGTIDVLGMASTKRAGSLLAKNVISDIAKSKSSRFITRTLRQLKVDKQTSKEAGERLSKMTNQEDIAEELATLTIQNVPKLITNLRQATKFDDVKRMLLRVGAPEELADMYAGAIDKLESDKTVHQALKGIRKIMKDEYGVSSEILDASVQSYDDSAQAIVNINKARQAQIDKEIVNAKSEIRARQDAAGVKKAREEHYLTKTKNVIDDYIKKNPDSPEAQTFRNTPAEQGPYSAVLDNGFWKKLPEELKERWAGLEFSPAVPENPTTGDLIIAAQDDLARGIDVRISKEDPGSIRPQIAEDGRITNMSFDETNGLTSEGSHIDLNEVHPNTSYELPLQIGDDLGVNPVMRMGGEGGEISLQELTPHGKLSRTLASSQDTLPVTKEISGYRNFHRNPQFNESGHLTSKTPAWAAQKRVGGSLKPYARKSGAMAHKSMQTDELVDIGGRTDSPMVAAGRQGGGFNNTVQKNVYEPTAQSIADRNQWRLQIKSRVFDIFKRHGMNRFFNTFTAPGESKKLFRAMHHMSEADAAKLRSGELSPADLTARVQKTSKMKGIKKVEPRHYEAAAEVRELMDMMHTDVNIIRRSLGKDEMGYLDNYAPQLLKNKAMREAMERQANQLGKSADDSALDFIPGPTEKFNPHAKKRLSQFNEKLHRQNMADLLERYVNSVSDDMFVTPAIENIKAHAAIMRNRGYKKSAQYWEDFIATNLVGKPGVLDKALNIDKMPQILRSAGERLVGARHTSALAFNPEWASVVQISSLANTMMMAGPVNTGRGILDFLTSPTARRQAKALTVPKLKTMGKTGTITTHGEAALERQLYTSPINNVNDVLGMMSNWIERAVTDSSALAGMRAARKQGLTGKEIQAYGNMVAERSQSMYVRELRAPALNEFFIRMGIPYQAYALETYKALREIAPEAIGIGKFRLGVRGGLSGTRQKGKFVRNSARVRLGQATGMVLGVTMANYWSEKVRGRPVYSPGAAIPFVGRPVENVLNAATGNEGKRVGGREPGVLDGSIAPVQDAYKLARAVATFAKDGDIDPLRRQLIFWGMGVGGIGGAPVVNAIIDTELAAGDGAVLTSSGRVKVPVDKSDFRTWIAGPEKTLMANYLRKWGLGELADAESREFKKRVANGEDPEKVFMNLYIRKVAKSTSREPHEKMNIIENIKALTLDGAKNFFMKETEELEEPYFDELPDTERSYERGKRLGILNDFNKSGLVLSDDVLKSMLDAGIQPLTPTSGWLFTSSARQQDVNEADELYYKHVTDNQESFKAIKLTPIDEESIHKAASSAFERTILENDAEKEVFKSVATLYDNREQFPPDVIDEALAKIGVPKEDAEYFNIARRDSEVKTVWVADAFMNSIPPDASRQEVMEELISLRREIGGNKNNRILNDTVVNNLKDMGIISADEAKIIKKFKWDPFDQKIKGPKDRGELVAGAGRAGAKIRLSVSALPKTKVPNVQMPQASQGSRIQLRASGGGQTTPPALQLPQAPSASPQQRLQALVGQVQSVGQGGTPQLRAFRSDDAIAKNLKVR